VKNSLSTSHPEQVKKCEFEDLKESLVKDMIELGKKSDELRETPLATKELDLNIATTTCRAAELAHEQVLQMKSNVK
jgi:hypothetical protein